MSKRADHEGTVYYSKSDQCWIAQLPSDPITHKRPKRRAKTRRDAYAKLREMQQERAKGINLSAKQPTLDQFFTTWLEEVMKRTIKPMTYYSYGALARRHIMPDLGDHRLDQLTTPMIQHFINGMADAFAPRTVHNVYSRLHSALAKAVEWRLISYNVAAGVTLPKLAGSKIVPPTVAEVRTYLGAAEGRRNAALYHVFALLGLRAGEGSGLIWSDFDPDEATLTISQQAQYIPRQGIHFITPKSVSSLRTLPVTPRLLARLNEHKKTQQEEQRLLGTTWKDHDLIFASEVGTPFQPRNLNRQFYTIRNGAGLPPFRLHDFRHFVATQLDKLKVNQIVIRDILGHGGTSNVTEGYMHTTIDDMRAALDELEQLLEAA